MLAGLLTSASLFKFYQALGKVRASQAALRRGSMETVLADDARRVFAFARVLEAERVVAAFNASDREVTVDLPAPGAAVVDLLSGRRLKAKDQKVWVTLPAQSAAYLALDTRQLTAHIVRISLTAGRAGRTLPSRGRSCMARDRSPSRSSS